jgi:hypothetical protein
MKITVQELIDKLSKLPLDQEVQALIPGDADGILIKEVQFTGGNYDTVFLVLDA